MPKAIAALQFDMLMLAQVIMQPIDFRAGVHRSLRQAF